MRTKRTVSSRKRHSLKAKSGGGKFKGLIDTAGGVKKAPVILSCPEFNDLANELSSKCNFIKGNVYFNKYGDGTPKIFMDELTVKLLRGRKVYFLAYFSFNECTGENPATNIMDQYMFMCSLASIISPVFLSDRTGILTVDLPLWRIALSRESTSLL